jgi:hypothetical protein
MDVAPSRALRALLSPKGGCSCATHCAAARGRREPQRSEVPDYQAGMFELQNARRISTGWRRSGEMDATTLETARCDAEPGEGQSTSCDLGVAVAGIGSFLKQ